MREVQFDIRLRVRGHVIPAAGVESQRCPICEDRLSVHQPDPGNPQRLLANCTCLECGVWFALILTPNGKVSYMIRLPSVVEMTEAIARLGEGDGRATGLGD